MTFEISRVYSFDLQTNPNLPNNYPNATVLSIMSEKTARKFIPTQELHVAMFPYLPNGTPNDPKGYSYVEVELASGFTTILGLPWIKTDSIVLVSSTTINVLIGDVSSSDVTRIRNALVQNGFNSLTIRVGN